MNRLIDLDWQPVPRKVRQFAVCLAILLLLAAWYDVMRWPALVAAPLVLVVAWLRPAVIKPLYVIVTIVTLPIGMLVGEMALAIIYLAVFVPIGCVFRWLSRDALRRTIDRRAVSYWEECSADAPKKSYLRRY